MINRKRYYLIVSVALLFTLGLTAQKITAVDRTELNKREDTLKSMSRNVALGETPVARFHANDSFVRKFVQTLKIKNSFYYPFDSLNISKLYSPDSVFRIFTWQLKKDEYIYHQMGAIQMNTADGSLKLLSLHDRSSFTAKPWDSTRTRNNWIGAIYYKIIMKEHDGKKYYTLIGFDDFSVNTNKKWMEILHFDNRGEPVFGGKFISFKDDTGKNKRPAMDRYFIEYKKEAKTFFNYDPELDIIIVDHLVSETDEPEKKFTYIPDGDYEAFRWQNGQWVHVDKLFNEKLKDGDFPKEKLLYDDAGNIDERQLEEASQKNIDKKKPPKPPVKKTEPVKKKTGGG